MAENSFPLTFPIPFGEVPPIGENIGIQTEGEGKIYSFGNGKITLYKE